MKRYRVKIDTPWASKGTIYEVTEELDWCAEWYPVDYPEVFEEVITNEKETNQNEFS